jgi:hypothetical protein
MYAIDCYARPDWGGAPEHETRYEFGTVDDAVSWAVGWLNLVGPELREVAGATVVRDDPGSPEPEEAFITPVPEGWSVHYCGTGQTVYAAEPKPNSVEPPYGMLHDYLTGDALRPATEGEKTASDAAERTFGGGAFVLPADLFTRPHQYGSERIVYTS